jgi:hypothetical protein
MGRNMSCDFQLEQFCVAMNGRHSVCKILATLSVMGQFEFDATGLPRGNSRWELATLGRDSR